MIQSDTFRPKWTSKPGDTISDILAEKSMSLPNFAKLMGLNVEEAIGLIKGTIVINEDIASNLQLYVGGSKRFWLKRENEYQECVARYNEREEASWIQKLPLKEMVEFGWISKENTNKTGLLNYFNVPDINAWHNKYNQIYASTAFRKSSSLKSQLIPISAWLRQGEIQSYTTKCNSWNPTLFTSRFDEIKLLTQERNPEIFVEKLKAICSECGIALTIVRTPKGCPASGATKFINSSCAIMILSFRYLTDDHFWFTFFHEAAHLILHSQNTIFVEDLSGDYKDSIEEKQANEFAHRALVPLQAESELDNIQLTKMSIARFARKWNLSPGIVVGQLQHLGRVPRNHFNYLKVRFHWNDLHNAVSRQNKDN